MQLKVGKTKAGRKMQLAIRGCQLWSLFRAAKRGPVQQLAVFAMRAWAKALAANGSQLKKRPLIRRLVLRTESKFVIS